MVRAGRRHGRSEDVWRGLGPPNGETYAGGRECNDCHSAAAANDHVLGAEVRLAGQLALRDATADRNASTLLAPGTPLDTAVALLQQRHLPKHARLLARARAAGSRARPAHASYELSLPSPVVGDLDDAAQRLTAALTRASAKRGPTIQPRAVVTRDGGQTLVPPLERQT